MNNQDDELMKSWRSDDWSAFNISISEIDTEVKEQPHSGIEHAPKRQSRIVSEEPDRMVYQGQGTETSDFTPIPIILEQQSNPTASSHLPTRGPFGSRYAVSEHSCILPETSHVERVQLASFDRFRNDIAAPDAAFSGKVHAQPSGEMRSRSPAAPQGDAKVGDEALCKSPGIEKPNNNECSVDNASYIMRDVSVLSSGFFSKMYLDNFPDKDAEMQASGDLPSATGVKEECTTPMAPPEIYPTDKDVLCGRGGDAAQHNSYYIELCEIYASDYSATKKRGEEGKRGIALRVVRAIQAANGRFLKRTPEGIWEVLAEEDAVEKAGHCLRDMARRSRRA